jgi:hypothetical protein
MSDEERPGLSDEVVLAHLGSAVLLCWDELPFHAQTRILAQTNDIIGLAPIPDIRSRIVELLLRRSRI